MAIATLLYSFVEQRSARQSVTLEIAGSIPVEAAITLKRRIMPMIVLAKSNSEENPPERMGSWA